MTDFEVFAEMAKGKMDIKVSTNLVEAKGVKAGGLITVGVDSKTYHDISKQMILGEQTHYVALYVVNKKQFEALKNPQVVISVEEALATYRNTILDKNRSTWPIWVVMVSESVEAGKWLGVDGCPEYAKGVFEVVNSEKQIAKADSR